MADNRNKAEEIDESILEETPPNINEPQTPPEETDPDEANVETEEIVEEETPEETPPEETVEDNEPAKTEETPPEEPTETEDDREKRYKAQQTETQIQAAKNKALIDKVDQANDIPEPTEQELRGFVAQDGVDWDDLTPFEQATAKRSFKSEKSLQLIREAASETKKIDEYAHKLDDFIDSTDGKPEFVDLSGHESEFRKYAMVESHRGAPLDVLIGAFLHNLPKKAPKRSNLFEKGSGGEKETNTGKITDADAAAALRLSNPREYKRQIKSGKISLDL